MKQSNLIEKIERNFKEEISNTMVYQTPAGNNNSDIRPTANELKICANKKSKYQLGVGIHLYLIKYSRPDITDLVRDLSKVNDGAIESHWKSSIRLLKYVVKTNNRFLCYKVDIDNNEEKWEIKSFSDSNYAGYKDSTISVTGCCIYVNGCLVSRKSKG